MRLVHPGQRGCGAGVGAAELVTAVEPRRGGSTPAAEGRVAGVGGGGAEAAEGNAGEVREHLGRRLLRCLLRQEVDLWWRQRRRVATGGAGEGRGGKERGGSGGGLPLEGPGRATEGRREAAAAGGAAVAEGERGVVCDGARGRKNGAGGGCGGGSRERREGLAVGQKPSNEPYVEMPCIGLSSFPTMCRALSQ